ncbi:MULTISPECIES: Fur-regulated basic protein FbpA [Bacillales]|uniref:Fur-regulated basic protein FbpA n=1 Tax=Bacillales TaxID=1385 RepID=UPI00148D7092|nr:MULTISPECIES: Fur-regulated basic protein FbpA [Bacillales]NNU96193.1 Fur-regulated basic protein FbpA [Anoxybacillus sp. EFIL]NNV04642.1 Fur-regulated basic protein FbpA [Brevibacillus sp. MCWH]
MMAVLREVAEKQKLVQERKEYLIDFLIDYEVYEGSDGRQLYELPLVELERMYIALRCQIGREMSQTRS